MRERAPSAISDGDDRALLAQKSDARCSARPSFASSQSALCFSLHSLRLCVAKLCTSAKSIVLAGVLAFAVLVALPVQAAIDLQYFNAVSSSSAVLLEWATASEYNTAGFEILKKREGEPDSSYQRIGFYNAKGGPNQGAQYDTLVTNLHTGVSYCFRLREVSTEDEPGEVRDLCGYGIGVTPTYTPNATPTLSGTATTSAVLFPTATIDPALAGQQPFPTVDPFAAAQQPVDPFAPTPTFDPFAPIPTWTPTIDPFAPIPTWTPTIDPFAPIPTWTPTIDPFAPQSPLETPTLDPFAPIPTWTPTFDPFATATPDPFAIAAAPAAQATDPATGYLIDPATGWPIDPMTGIPYDPSFGVPSAAPQPDSPLLVPTATLDPVVAAGIAAQNGGPTPTPTSLYIVVTAAPPSASEGVAAVPSPWPTLVPTPVPALLGLLAPNAQNLTVLMLCFIFLSATTLGALGLMSVVLYLRARGQREDDRARLRTRRYP